MPVGTVVANYKDFPLSWANPLSEPWGCTFDRFLLERSYVALFKNYNNEHLKTLIKLIKVSRWYTSLVLHSADLKMGLYDRSDRPDKHFPLPIGIVVTNIR